MDVSLHKGVSMLKKLIALNRSVSRPIEVTLPDGSIIVVNDLKYSRLLKAGLISASYPARRVDI